MHIVVAGASGRTGREVVRRAVSLGMRVAAIVRPGTEFAAPPGVSVLRADVLADQVAELPADADVVISTLGMGADLATPVCEPGTRNLIAAMERVGITRMVAVSAVPAYAAGLGEPWWFRIIRTLVRRRRPAVYDDIEAMERLLQASRATCRWTIVRPGYLTDGPATEYRLLAERNATTSVHRVDLAHALLDLAGDDRTVGRAYGLRRGRTRKAVAA